MNVIVCTVGRMRGLGWQTLNDEYLQRIRHYVRCDVLEFRDDVELMRRRPRVDVTVALEVRGEGVGSVELAKMIERWGCQGKGQIAFVVGGTEGIPAEYAKQADFQLSLSSMTLPHRLARVVLLEQLYRSLTIIRGEPYARES